MIDESLLVPGVKVRIIDDWDQIDGHRWENLDGLMDKWLGKVMTIREVSDSEFDWGLEKRYLMVEDEDDDGGGWLWWANGFSEVIYEPHQMSLVDAATDDELMDFLFGDM